MQEHYPSTLVDAAKRRLIPPLLQIPNPASYTELIFLSFRVFRVFRGK